MITIALFQRKVIVVWDGHHWMTEVKANHSHLMTSKKMTRTSMLLQKKRNKKKGKRGKKPSKD